MLDLIQQRVASAKNCMSCSNYIQCRDPSKSIIYLCDRFSSTRKSEIDGSMRLADLLGSIGAGYQLHLPDPEASVIVQPDADEFDIRKIIDDIITNDEPVSSDIKISDRDFPQAPNFYKFCVSDKYLNQKPFLEQAIIGTRVMAEYCPACTDMNWFDHSHRVDDSLGKFERKVALLDRGICPHCKKDRVHFFNKGTLNFYNEAALAVGQRGGKSAWLGMMAAYLTHLQIKLQKPNEVYGLLRANILHGTFAALTYAQAKDTLFEPYIGNIRDSPWFAGYHAMLDDAQERFGEELYKLKDTFVLYKHRRLLVYPAGPDKRTLRGRTRFMACLDGDSLVSTARGLKRIKHNLQGERTHVGNNHFPVTNWTPTGIRQCFRVTTVTGNYIDCTANHELKTQRGWVRTDALRENDKLELSLGGHFPGELRIEFNPSYGPIFSQVCRTISTLSTFEPEDLRSFGKTVPAILDVLVVAGFLSIHYYRARDPDDTRCPFYYVRSKTFNVDRVITDSRRASGDRKFPERMTKELASLIGYMLADGSYSDNQAEFFFVSGSRSRSEHFVKCYLQVFNCAPLQTKYRTADGKKMVRYTVDCPEIKACFRYLGLLTVSDKRKQLPWSILEAPRDCAIAAIAAIYDCCGGVKRKKIFYRSDSYRLLHQVQLLLQRLGILTHTKSTQGGEPGCLTIRGSLYQKLFKDLVGFSTNTLILPVDLKTSDPLPGRHGVVLVDIAGTVALGLRKVYDITVDDPDHGFTANGIVVHNSIDELGWFPNDANNSKVKMNATEVYIALERSLLTVRASAETLARQGFSNIPTAYFLNISSPSSVRDKIMELVRKSHGSRKIYGLIKPTWEMNPKVPRSALEEEFRKDPVAAMRDYGAEPPLTASPFISSQSAVEDCFSEKLNRVRITHLQKKSTDGTISRYARIDRITRLVKPSVLAIDAGYSNNSFACSIASLEEHKYPRISLLLEVMPLPGIPLNYSKIYTEILVPLCDECNVVLVGADRWNSLKILSDLNEELDVQTVQHSIKYPEMQLFKSYIDDKQILFPLPRTPVEDILAYDPSNYPHCFKNRPEDHFVLQLLTVQDTGSAVIKGDQLTDDLVRASMLAITLLLDPEYEELFAGADREVAATASPALALYRGFGGGSLQGSRSTTGGPPKLGVLRSYS